MNGWLSLGLDFLSNSPLAIWIAAGGIALSALAAYWLWFRPAASRLQGVLVRLAKALEVEADEGWPAAREQARAALRDAGDIRSVWQETEDRVIPLTHGQRTIFVTFGAPRDIWSGSRLLSRQINLPLADAVPNLLVGVGLLFTFFFLTLALTQATAALLPGSGSQAAAADLTGATRGLLSAAGAKFLTSLTGLLASILWTVAARRRMARLNASAEAVLDRLARLVPSGGAEMAVFSQLQLARELHETGTRHVDVTREAGAVAARHADLAEELLNESREQTGTFKRFETDLAVSLAGAISSAFTPQMEAMTERLVSAINGLSERIGAMNQEALQKMMDDFAAMLKGATESEMNQLRETLALLAERLDGAGKSIGQTIGDAAQGIGKAGEDLMTSVQHVASSLADGATRLEGATQGVKEAMNDLDVSIREAGDLGRQGSGVVREMLQTADGVAARMQGAAKDLETSGGALERVSGVLSEAVDAVEEMVREQRAVVDAVKDATPRALSSVDQVVVLLGRTVQETAALMTQTRDSMAATARTLQTTVAEITTGISEYSGQVTELHRRMDDALARAVGSLDKGVTSLEEAVEELGEILTTRLPKG